MTSSSSMKTVVFGAGILFFNSIFMFLFRFVYRIVSSRALGPETYGLVVLGETILNILVLVSLLGLNQALSRFLPELMQEGKFARVRGILAVSFVSSLVLSGILGLLLYLFSDMISVGIFGNSNLSFVLFFMALALPFYVGIMILTKTFIALRKPKESAIITTFLRNGGQLLLVLLLLLVGFSLRAYLWIYVISSAIAFLIGFWMLYKYLRMKIGISRHVEMDFKRTFSYAIPLFMTGFFVQMMGYIDMSLLGIFLPESYVGVYSVSISLATSFWIFLTSFSYIFFPVVSGLLAKGDYSHSRELYLVISRWIFTLSVPFAFGLILFAPQILTLLFGEAYATGYAALIILVMGYFFNVITGPASDVLKALGRVKFIFWFNVLMAGINLILNILLIPKYFLVGAAVSTTFTLFLKEFVIFLVAKKELQMSFNWKKYLPSLFAVLFSFGLAFGFSLTFPIFFESFFVLIVLALGFCIYGFLLFLFRAFYKEDLQVVDLLLERFKIRDPKWRAMFLRFVRNN